MINQTQWQWLHLIATQRSIESLNNALKGVLATLVNRKAFFLYTPKMLINELLTPNDLALAFKHGRKDTEPDLAYWLDRVTVENPIYQENNWLALLTHQILRPASLLIIELDDSEDNIDNQYLLAMLELHAQMFMMLSRYPLDPLTGLYNRAHFDRWVRRIYQRNLFATLRIMKDSQWCLALMDLDRFSQVNENYGFLRGDQILALIGQQLSTAFRPDDGLFRYAGDRFAILLRESNLETAFQVLDRFRDRISEFPFPIKERLTATFGMTQLDDRLWVSVIGDAQCALESGKAEGGNRLVLFEHLLSQGRANPSSDDWYGLEWID